MRQIQRLRAYNDDLGKNPYDRSPRNRLAKAKSLGWIVTRLAWIAARLVSSNNETR